MQIIEFPYSGGTDKYSKQRAHAIQYKTKVTKYLHKVKKNNKLVAQVYTDFVPLDIFWRAYNYDIKPETMAHYILTENVSKLVDNIGRGWEDL